jgi:hypothetical protein
MRVDRLLGEWGIPKDSAAGRRAFEERMEWRRGEDLRGEFKRVERGWCLGGEELLQHHPALGLDRRALEHGQPRAFGPKRQKAGALQDAGALFDALVVPVTNPVTYHEPARI